MEKKANQTEIKVKTVVERPPVVAVLGHVDHGKTSLLDAIRQTKVAEKEFGGITQHIGAYQITYKGKKITFIDTPGHEAFSKMRARGAQVTDIALLVVAADDGVMPQTKESIAHIKAANVPLIVAANKIDLPGVDMNKLKQQLADNNVLVEEYGGDAVIVPLSAKTKQGIDDLLDMILLVTEMQEIKTDLSEEANGVVIESFLDKSRGPVATVLMKEGILKVGDTVKVQEIQGKIKAMVNDKGQSVKEALPSTPVEVLGLEKVPAVGEILKISRGGGVLVKPEAEQFKKRSFDLQLEDNIALILKTDVAGTLESIAAAIENIPSEKKVKFLLKETGDVNESDVLLAAASKALIIAFNVKVSVNAKRLSEEEKVFIREYKIIYDLLEEFKEGLVVKAQVKEVSVGKGKILALFTAKEGNVAGCRVEEGSFSINDTIKVLRGERELGRSKIKSLKQGSNNLSKVKSGEECGIILENNIDFAVGDIIESYQQKS